MAVAGVAGTNFLSVRTEHHQSGVLYIKAIHDDAKIAASAEDFPVGGGCSMSVWSCCKMLPNITPNYDRVAFVG